MNYDDFIDSKSKVITPAGFEPKPIKAPAFDWQAYVIQWAVRQGRAAIFGDTGTGKTLQQLEWARHFDNRALIEVLEV